MSLLARHRATDEIAFGARGSRDKQSLLGYAAAIAETLGDASGARIVLACEDRYRFAAALLATWSCGATAVLPANVQPATLRALLRADMKLLRDRDDDMGSDVRELERAARALLPERIGQAHEQTAVVLYTSGSGGEPVAHPKTFGQLFSECAMLIEAFALDHRTVLTAVPPHHIYGLLFGVLVPLLGGGRLSRGAPLLPGEVVREAREHRADVLVAVPPHLMALAAYDADLPSFTRVFSSGAPLPEATDEALRRRSWRITQVLGSTETGGVASRSSCAEDWRALPGVELRLAADGALEARSEWASSQRQAFTRLGDRVELTAAGFRHLGRSDDVVKIGGRRVDLGEIERHLEALPTVRAAHVVARATDSMRGLELCAAIEGDDPQLTPQHLRRALSQHLDPVTVPRRYRVLTALPRSERGKVLREEILALFERWEIPVETAPSGELSVYIPHDLGYFRGHFPETPILPGVVQLQLIAASAARQRWRDLGPITRVTRIKFKRLVGPGERLPLALTRRDGGMVEFTLGRGDTLASSGRLHFREGSS